MIDLDLDNFDGLLSLTNLTHNYRNIPEKPNEILQKLGGPHVESFNYLLREGLQKAVEDLVPMEFSLPNANKSRVSIKVLNARLCKPDVHGPYIFKSTKLYPKECKERAATYKGLLKVKVSLEIDGVNHGIVEKDLGRIPIVVKESDICHLANLSPRQLVEVGEHEEEWGGYFIVRGHERLIRMLHVTRRNYPITLQRPAWKQRGTMFSDIGVMIRCVKEDQTCTNNVLHFVNNGGAKLMFSYQRTMYYVPIMLILKCLLDVPDVYILKEAMARHEDDAYFKGCLMNMLRQVHEDGIHTHLEAKQYIGKIFRVRLNFIPDWKTDVEVCDFLIQRCLAIHLDNNEDKFNLYIMMLQKLFMSVENKCCVEGADAVMMHELLLGGHLYLQLLKEKIQTWLYMLKVIILKKANMRPNFALTPGEFTQALRRSGTLEAPLESFISTGNLMSHSTLGLMQDKGLTIVCENINRLRYMSHFRSVHRGSFFQEMRSSEPRQLLPDAWGFICPVHTPDGSPCGLLNHLTKFCEITTVSDAKLVANIPLVLMALGMIPLNGVKIVLNHNKYYIVMLDGRVLGHVMKSEAARFVDKLRVLKIAGQRVPKMLEIVLVPLGRKCGQFPGLFLFTGAGRMMRPVINRALKKIEYIGTFEQVYLDICIYPEEAYKVTTHQEISDTAFLSNLASLIPLPDCNQSPRNMYQCQMGKQTMGTPLHTWQTQAETKVYRLQTPMSPLFRPAYHDLIGLDEFPMGTNAIIAVISYTGYDMEDAMIINKSSFERGFGHGCVYKSEFIELKSKKSYFERDPNNSEMEKYLDTDGLPYVGRLLKTGQPLCCFYDDEKSKYCFKKWQSNEDAYVDNVRLCGGIEGKECMKVCIVVRVPRNPSVGDKFASRAGQKGICSYLWPAEDLPFTEIGLVPDIVFNPHSFPSRMTIAMMIELMAGKSAAIHGLAYDATPFRFSEKDTAIDYFGKMLEIGGYNYFGTEKMYSGTDGQELKADVFFGIVHYQRLRHMVTDKWQVRSTGPMDNITHQPVKGRRRGGGVRVGEMERDSFLSHGASFLIQDRIINSSDKVTMLICATCRSILTPVILAQQLENLLNDLNCCHVCKGNGKLQEVEVPYIFRLMASQLISVNITVKLKLENK
ncbi:hypothetical protein L9F63_018336 [Diploptera punctata]|uniref:DNA-directed RNA polymerase subunit beta n=1 Tax=Diploptera punctata TaxID=6984 RepID=A0AAD8EFU4_DIPPU|nr:hypothetical protein L9F63_018336 [Diploptera punctata]